VQAIQGARLGRFQPSSLISVHTAAHTRLKSRVPTPLVCQDRGRSGFKGASRRPVKIQVDKATLRQLALPAAGVLLAAAVIAPVIGGVLFAALGISFAIATTALAFSLSWLVVPGMLLFLGVPFLMGATGFVATTASFFLVPVMVQALVLGATVWFGTIVAKMFLSSSEDGPKMGPNGTIDVEAETVTDWKEDLNEESRRREEELRQAIFCFF
jgi:hypothetical protein